MPDPKRGRKQAKTGARSRYGRLDYSSCSLGELLTFCHNRSVQLLGNVSHDTLVAALGRQDRKDRFDFLGLPVELRNLVYEGLLVDKRERRVQASTGHKARYVLPLKCHRQILATKRRTYKEAKPVFVSENKGLCLFFQCAGTELEV